MYKFIPAKLSIYLFPLISKPIWIFLVNVSKGLSLPPPSISVKFRDRVTELETSTHAQSEQPSRAPVEGRSRFLERSLLPVVRKLY